ncbi:molybdopterin-guanine dinucleotide biosynthesis protein MobA [Agrobacterium albertimagni AOL15]|uniref:Molybdenum cofactor guanylyltransferase n=1 Tax=Agrobacterium albertimagni AOL15 TaxID=1156935 RepID=K2Q357_9HYPH|nr:molybdenum cofactor guanylyltransferase MobA [Agrobacterium albertimagni]EKF59610.1 molybdopterin-guanine dinucleotide biosynthesis protein MobA [Agrobacterium albertimagni AOL15]
MTQDTRPPAVILAGGLSRRMGRDKAELILGTTPLALRTAERLRLQTSAVYLNASEGHPLAAHLPLLQDTRPDRPGPLAGVLAGLKLFTELPGGPAHVLTTPCDTPFLPRDLLKRLQDGVRGDAIMLAACNGRTHPITALWPVTLAEDLERWLDDPDHRRVFDFVARHPNETVEFAPLEGPFGPVDPFFNINTPEDLAMAEAIIEQGTV